MPTPFEGLVAVADYGSMLEAQLAVATLTTMGIEATLSYDPALNSVAPYFASDRVVEVVVHEHDLDRARRVLTDATDALPPEFRSPELLEWSEGRVANHPGRRHPGHLLGRAALAGALVLTVASIVVFAVR